MATKKDKYEKATEFQKNVKMDLDGWPRTTHEAAVKFLNLKKDDFVLDVGCGKGVHFPYYLKKTKNVYGIDLSENVLDRIALKDKVNLSCQDFEEGTSFGDEFFDAIVMVDVIEHLANRYDTMRELHRILKKGGILVLITPNVVKARNRFRLLFGKYPHTSGKTVKPDTDHYDGGHLQYFTFESLRELGEGEGFNVKNMFGFGRFGKLHNFFKPFMSGSICAVMEKK